VYPGQKKTIPTKAYLRRDFLAPYIDELTEFIRVNQPCVVIGMGKLAGEILVGPSIFSTIVNTYWEPKFLPFIKYLGLRKVWLTYMPDAALLQPDIAVNIAGIIYRATLDAHIATKIDADLIVPSFWIDHVTS
jgi:hypothetical protein